MKKFLRVVYAEFIKQNKSSFCSKVVIFSLLLWPIVDFAELFFSFKPFDNITISDTHIMTMIRSEYSFISFLITGSLGFMCFWSMVQSAWQMSKERSDGTLEIIFLSPANRLAILYGRALGSLISDVWMFFLFSVFIILIKGTSGYVNLISLIFAFFILVLSATIWGGFMNSIFLFSRDATLVFYIFDTPMNIFSGVSIPINVFPFWGKVISSFFPLTYCLVLIRDIINMDFQYFNGYNFIKLIILLIIIIFITKIILIFSEKNLKKNGSFNFY